MLRDSAHGRVEGSPQRRGGGRVPGEGRAGKFRRPQGDVTYCHGTAPLNTVTWYISRSACFTTVKIYT